MKFIEIFIILIFCIQLNDAGLMDRFKWIYNVNLWPLGKKDNTTTLISNQNLTNSIANQTESSINLTSFKRIDLLTSEITLNKTESSRFDQAINQTESSINFTTLKQIDLNSNSTVILNQTESTIIDQIAKNQTEFLNNLENQSLVVNSTELSTNQNSTIITESTVLINQTDFSDSPKTNSIESSTITSVNYTESIPVLKQTENDLPNINTEKIVSSYGSGELNFTQTNSSNVFLNSTNDSKLNLTSLTIVSKETTNLPSNSINLNDSVSNETPLTIVSKEVTNLTSSKPIDITSNPINLNDSVSNETELTTNYPTTIQPLVDLKNNSFENAKSIGSIILDITEQLKNNLINELNSSINNKLSELNNLNKLNVSSTTESNNAEIIPTTTINSIFNENVKKPVEHISNNTEETINTLKLSDTTNVETQNLSTITTSPLITEKTTEKITEKLAEQTTAKKELPLKDLTTTESMKEFLTKSTPLIKFLATTLPSSSRLKNSIKPNTPIIVKHLNLGSLTVGDRIKNKEGEDDNQIYKDKHENNILKDKLDELFSKFINKFYFN